MMMKIHHASQIHYLKKNILTLETSDNEHRLDLQEKEVPVIPKIRLVDKIKDFCIQLKTEEGSPQIYKLPNLIVNTYPEKKLRKITVGSQTYTETNEDKILIVGSTGSGKTTFLNGVSNYLYGVEWEDNCRFKIVSDEDEGEQNKSKSQVVQQ